MKKLNITAVLLACSLLCSCSMTIVNANDNSHTDSNIHTNLIPPVSYIEYAPPDDIPVIYAPVYITSEYIPLDEIIFPAINEIISDDMSDKEKLEAIYSYVLQFSFKDRSLDIPEEKRQYREQLYAMSLFEKGYGTSYDYSAAFSFMAHSIGYEPKLIYGNCLFSDNSSNDHAWVVIEIDGTDYIFDPATEVILRQNKEKYGRERFMKTYAEVGIFYSAKPENT